MALSNYLESGLLHHIFRNQTFPKPSNISIALCSEVPNDSHTGSTLPEVPSGDGINLNGYSRYNLGNPAVSGNDSWQYDIADHNAGSGLIKNAFTFIFNTALRDWGWVSGIALVDSSSYKSGNVLVHAAIPKPRVIYEGDSPKYDASVLKIRFN